MLTTDTKVLTTPLQVNQNNSSFSNNVPNITNMNTIPNISQGGFIITSNGNIAYIPPNNNNSNQQSVTSSDTKTATATTKFKPTSSTESIDASIAATIKGDKTSQIINEPVTSIKVDFDHLNTGINKNSNNNNNNTNSVGNTTTMDLNSFFFKSISVGIE